MVNRAENTEGLRGRKRRETRQRIAETGLRLFLENGYEETTLDAIAEASNISRRTFFYYFSSKEEILLAWQSGTGEAIKAAILEERSDQAPIDAVLNAVVQLASRYEESQHILIEQLLTSTEQLRASKYAKYSVQETAVFEGLCRLWPQAKRREALRLVAMASIGALRIAVEQWAEHGGKKPLSKYIREAFANLKAEVKLGA